MSTETWAETVPPDFTVSVVDTASGPRFLVDASRTFLPFRQPSTETFRMILDPSAARDLIAQLTEALQ